jgi:hypothetical protein
MGTGRSTARSGRRPAADSALKAIAAGAALLAFSAHAGAASECAAAGEPVQWVADYCMLKMETDDEIAVSGCIEEERKQRFPNDCASNLHFKEGMCKAMIRNGTRTGTVDQCVKDPAFKGRVVEAGGVGR